MNEHRYILEKYKGLKTRYTCPSCNKPKEFTMYIDTLTEQHIHSSVGKCNREIKCGYHYSPKQYFQDNHLPFETTPIKRYITPLSTPLKISFIDVEIFKESLSNYEENNFVKFLIHIFGNEVTSELIAKYFIGTNSNSWKGATVFWEIDLQGKIRTGKIMLYDSTKGNRVKQPYDHINWMHSVLNLPEYNLQQCLFGSHLLNDKTKPVAIVESEKTAIIASVYLPQFIWCAVGSLQNLNAEKLKLLKERNVFLFPDLNGLERWKAKASELAFPSLSIVDLFERIADEEELKLGLDIADYLMLYDYKDFFEYVDPQQKPGQSLNIQQILIELEKTIGGDAIDES